MRRHACVLFVLAQLGLSPLVALGSPEAPVLSLTPSIGYQQIEHFGASAAWWAQAVGTWPQAQVDAVLDLLFDPAKGIGLGLVRYNLGGGKAEGASIPDPWRSAATWTEDPAAQRIVDGAVERGAKVVLFANSPPAALTVTGSPTGNQGVSNLRPDAREAFAHDLADAALTLGLRGWPIIAVSPMNEPQWDWQPKNGQEGSHYSPAEAHALLTAVAREWKARGLTVELSAVDSGEWKLGSNVGYLAELWGDPELRPVLAHYAVHSYWSATGDRQALASHVASEYPGLRLWQTEWTEMKGGRDVGMSSALVLAKTVQDDLVNGGVTSWQAWIAVSKYDYRDGLLYADEASQTFEPTKRLWALGNWSKFVRSGAHRIQVTPPVLGRLGVSAFANPDGTLVAVLVNEGAQAVEFAGVATTGFSAQSLDLWETSTSYDLEKTYQGAPGAFTVPPYSVVTAVLR